MIFFDQRGTGTSEPSLDCPEVHEAVAAVFGAAAPFEEEDALVVDALVACRDRLAAEGVDFDQYDTSATADDVADLKRAMGVDEWNLFGVSYGTTVALEVLRAHPDGVRSVVIDSAYPTTVPGGLASDAANLERVLGVFYDGCAADPACAAAYPTLQADLEALVETMNATPYRGRITNTVLGREQDIVITGSDVLSGLFVAFYDANLIPQLPSLLQVVRSGNGGGVIDQLAAQGIAFTNGAAEAETAAVECADRQRLNDEEAAAALLAERPELSTFGLLDIGVCAAFGVGSAPAAFNEPVKSDVARARVRERVRPGDPAGRQRGRRGGAVGVHVRPLPWPWPRRGVLARLPGADLPGLPGGSDGGRGHELRDNDRPAGVGRSRLKLRVVAALALVVAGCTSTGGPGLTAAQLRGAAESSVCGEGMSARSGETTIGDLTGDGVDEGAVVVTCTIGNLETFDVYVYGRGPDLVGRVPVETVVPTAQYEVLESAIAIDGRVLEVAAYGYSDDDAHCCPSVVAVTRWTLVEGAFFTDQSRPLGGAVIGPGTLGPLRADMTYMEASRAANQPVDVSSDVQFANALEEPCADFAFVGAPGGVRGVGGDGVAASYHVFDRSVRTSGDVGVGSTRAEVLDAHRNARAMDDDVYVDGTLRPGEPAALRFVFDTDDTVEYMITGLATFAALPEGCA